MPWISLRAFGRFWAFGITGFVTAVSSFFAAGVLFQNRYYIPWQKCTTLPGCSDSILHLWEHEIVPDLWLFLLLVFWVVLFVGFAFWTIVRSYKQASNVALGYWLVKVTLPVLGSESEEVTEYNISQVRYSEGGVLEYRGVARGNQTGELVFCWIARNAIVHPAGGRSRFVFHTNPEDIIQKPPTMPGDLSNIGSINFFGSRRASGKGQFFDFTLGGDYVERKVIELNPIKKFGRKEQKCFDEYFSSPNDPIYKANMKLIFSSVGDRFGLNFHTTNL